MHEMMYLFIIYNPNHSLASEPSVIEYILFGTASLRPVLKDNERPKFVPLCLLFAI